MAKYKPRHEAPKERGNRLRDHVRSIGKVAAGAALRAWDSMTMDQIDPRLNRQIQAGFEQTRKPMDTAKTAGGDLARALSQIEQYRAGRGATERGYVLDPNKPVASTGTNVAIDVTRGARGRVANPAAPAKMQLSPVPVGEDMLFSVELGRRTNFNYQDGTGTDGLTVTLAGREDNHPLNRNTIDTLAFTDEGFTATRAYRRGDGTMTPGHPYEVSNEQLTGLVSMVQGYADNPRQLFEEQEAATVGAR